VADVPSGLSLTSPQVTTKKKLSDGHNLSIPYTCWRFNNVVLRKSVKTAKNTHAYYKTGIAQSV
jgi:hypothetical protein